MKGKYDFRFRIYHTSIFMFKKMIISLIAVCMFSCSIASATGIKPRIEANDCPKCGTHMTVHVGPWQYESSQYKTCSKHGKYRSYAYSRQYTYTCGNCNYSDVDFQFDITGCPSC